MAPRSRRVADRITAVVLIGAAGALASGCAGTPSVAEGNLVDAKRRVIELVKEAGRAIGPRATSVPVRGADELPCKKRFLGYVVGDTGARRAEVPVVVLLTGSGDGASLLPRIERDWRARGYTIDRSGLSDRSFPKVRARLDSGELLVATGYVGLPEVNLYAVSPCVRE